MGAKWPKIVFWNLQPSGTLVQPSGTKGCFDAPEKSFFQTTKRKHDTTHMRGIYRPDSF